MSSFRHLAIPRSAQIGLLAAGVAASVVTGRLLRKRNTSPSERLAAALLDTTHPESARRECHTKPEMAVTSSVRYALHLIAESSAGAFAARSAGDSTGTSCKSVHPYSGARSSVVVQQTKPNDALVFKLEFDGVCTVRGARSVGPVRLVGVTPARKVVDRLQFDFGEEYTVQIEANLNVSDFVATGANRIQGEMTMEDSRGVAGSLTILIDGTATGSLRRAGRVIGRFSGSVTSIQFLPFHADSMAAGGEHA